MLHFFLSYAHGHHDDDQLVAKLFDDLSAEVRQFAGLPDREQVGFLDQTIPPGGTWSTELVEALSACRVLVALCSPRYFGSEPCGKEWSIFEERVTAYEILTGHRPPVLIPIFWVPVAMPPVAARYHHLDPELGPFRHKGLRYLMRIQGNEGNNAYIDLLYTLAEQIVNSANAHEIPPPADLKPFDEIVGRFPAITPDAANGRGGLTAPAGWARAMPTAARKATP